jgi:putative oxidoreductase
MQRLFSTFPNSWPGLGLLNLRVLAAVCLVFHRQSAFGGVAHSGDPLLGIASGAICMVGALLLFAGLLTPFVALVLGLVEVSQIFFGTSFVADHAIQAAIALSIAVLGPGAWSLDARLYGRKRIDIER